VLKQDQAYTFKVTGKEGMNFKKEIEETITRGERKEDGPETGRYGSGENRRRTENNL